jgi:hypothetical protein
MEALTSGLPTIMTANTGHLDLVDDERCFPLRIMYKTPRGHWVRLRAGAWPPCR